MPEVVVGPLLRYVSETEATVFVEVSAPCRVEILGVAAGTFAVEGRHFALVCLEGLDTTRTHPYTVVLDGDQAWPPPDYPFPQPVIRLLPRDGSLRLLFGSCRASAPHRPPYTHQRWWHRKGIGIDVLRTYGLRMLRRPSAMWPDMLMMLGDQLYADQVSDGVRAHVADREVHADGPVEVLEDFEEFCLGYCDAWSEPVVRWLLSTLPSLMMFDDHEINDKWNTSQAWLDEKRRESWWETRIVGGLMAYWVYQHVGNLSPAQLAADETYREAVATGDGTAAIRRLAGHAEAHDGTSHFSVARDVGPARLVVADARTGRVLTPGGRRITTPDEWRWLTEATRGDHEHLLFASTLPFFLPEGMHHIEAWSEAVTDGAWGARLAGLGEKVRIGANLDHWACFGRSFAELEDLVVDVATGRHGPAPKSVLLFGGDVHHCWVSEVSLPDDAAPTATKVWQMVCSGLRKEVEASQRVVLQLGHSRAAAALGRALVATTGVAPPRLRWRAVTKPYFRNQVGTLEIAGGEVGVRVERVTGGWRSPRFETVIEEKLL